MKSSHPPAGEPPQIRSSGAKLEPTSGELRAFRCYLAEVMAEAEHGREARQARQAHRALHRFRLGEPLAQDEVRLLARALARQFLKRKGASPRGTHSGEDRA